MPSFDIVSELDMQEVDNAVNMAQKEIAQRFDFRGGKSSIELDKTAKKIKILADDDMKLRSIHQIVESKLAKREVDLRGLKYGKEESGSGGIIRQEIDLKAGLDKEEAKEITKLIKESKVKVQAQIQDEQVRVTSKSIDELQAAISVLKKGELKFPLQYINMRS
ncbi:MAG: YajQ family cyclic di-GMP-binding protein [Proteobacteria bacterium]|nr:YajQ family cyclic di-GMP-binding protein [Pseudomonadota bacterium]